MISTQTQLVALLGNPIAHSYSAALHNQNFQNLSLDYLYLPIESELEAIGDIVRGIRQMNFAGFNITRPYKVEIMKHIDELDELAQIIGSVNTVKKQDGKLIGFNTDGIGFVDSLKSELGFVIQGKTFFVLGAGGAARAVAVTLAFQGAGNLLIADLYPEAAEGLAQHINESIRSCAQTVPYDETGVRRAIAACDCIINASGVGMHPHTDRTPIDKQWLKSGTTVCDFTYNPEKTQFLLDAEAIGCPILNGLGMFVGQAAKAFEIWTGISAPFEQMKQITNNIMSEHH